MRMHGRQPAMTLLEMLVTLTLIVILVGALGTLGVRLQRQSEIRLTKSTLEVLTMALEQYQADQSEFVPQVSSQTELEYAIFDDEDSDGQPDGRVEIVQGEHVQETPELEMATWSSEALYYFLSRTPNSAALIETLMGQMITGKDRNGTSLIIEIPQGSGSQYDLIRFVDTWGMPIRYAYDPDDPDDPEDYYDAFPVLTSAGPDKTFDTPDDITNQE